MKLLDLGDDILCHSLVANLSITCLLNLLLTCKMLYNRRKQCIVNKGIKCILFGKLLNSHIDCTHADLSLQKDLNADISKIHNTFSLIRCIEHVYSVCEIGDYCVKMLEVMYNYKSTTKYNNNILRNVFSNDKWKMSNVSMLSYYEVVYHISHKKFRRLEYTLLYNLKFIDTYDYSIYTLSLIIHFINTQTSKCIKIAMLYIFYDYIQSILDYLFINYDKHKNFIQSIFDKRLEFEESINKTTGLPKYIKTLVINKIAVVNSEIEKKKANLTAFQKLL